MWPHSPDYGSSNDGTSSHASSTTEKLNYSDQGDDQDLIEDKDDENENEQLMQRDSFYQESSRLLNFHHQ